jgi:hypothetical protein
MRNGDKARSNSAKGASFPHLATQTSGQRSGPSQNEKAYIWQSQDLGLCDHHDLVALTRGHPNRQVPQHKADARVPADGNHLEVNERSNATLTK